MKNYRQKYLSFQRKMLLLYPIGLLAMIYYRWLACLFGRQHQIRMQSWLPHQLCRIFLKMHSIELEISGIEHLMQTQNTRRILAINHNSRLDGYILLALCPFPFKSFWSNTAHVTTENFSMIQAFGKLFDLFFVHDKTDMRKTVAEFKRAAAYLSEGGTVSFFPEGQFSKDGLVHGFGTACTSLAIRNAADIVPIVFFNTAMSFEKRDNATGPQVVKVRVLPALSTAHLSHADIFPLTLKLEALMNLTLQQSSVPQ